MTMNPLHGTMMHFGASHLSGSANANTAPSWADAATTSDAGLMLLQRIAGQ